MHKASAKKRRKGQTGDRVLIKLPMDIENKSMEIIEAELKELGYSIPTEELPLVKRAIHASADFDYAENLKFVNDAVRCGIDSLKNGSRVVTDTNMAKTGIHDRTLKLLGGEAVCFMGNPEIAAEAKEAGTTRAEISMRHAAGLYPDAVYAIGNAPTALITLSELIRKGFRPALVIGVPVGFVNVTESKDEALEVCAEYGVPAIIAMGRKGGSTIAAALVNALLYEASGNVR